MNQNSTIEVDGPTLPRKYLLQPSEQIQTPIPPHTGPLTASIDYDGGNHTSVSKRNTSAARKNRESNSCPIAIDCISLFHDEK